MTRQPFTRETERGLSMATVRTFVSPAPTSTSASPVSTVSPLASTNFTSTSYVSDCAAVERISTDEDVIALRLPFFGWAQRMTRTAGASDAFAAGVADSYVDPPVVLP